MNSGDWLTYEQASDLRTLYRETAFQGHSGTVYNDRYLGDTQAAYKVEVLRGRDQYTYVNGNVLPMLVKMAARFGLGLQLFGGVFVLRRRATLLNGNVIANRDAIRLRYRNAMRELAVTRPLWDAVKGIKANVLDPRMVDGIVAMARRWPEVMGIAYNGGSFEDFEGTHVAAEGTIAIRFWPVLFPYETQTRGLSAPLIFRIDSTGHVVCDMAFYESYGLHPHLFSHGGLCLGEGEGKFDSLLASLKNLRDWWVGTDHHPASGPEWASVACVEWWKDHGAAFWAYYGDEATLHQYPGWREIPPNLRQREIYGQRYPQVVSEMMPVTDDGLDIPGLSLPEWIAPRGLTAYYVEAPAVSDRSKSTTEDREATASTHELTPDALEDLLADYNRQQFEEHEDDDEDDEEHWECARCGNDLDYDQRYGCDHCGNDFCVNHYEADEYCTECWPTLMFVCADCDGHFRVTERNHCEECGDASCDNCSNYDAEREKYYCATHFPEGAEAGEHPTTEPTITVGTRCAPHGNINCRMCQVEGLYQEDYESVALAAGPYFCEVRVTADMNCCLTRPSPWRRRTDAHLHGGNIMITFVCQDHYLAMRPHRPMTPIQEAAAELRAEPVMEPMRYPVAEGWEPTGVTPINRATGLRCCHPECVALGYDGAEVGIYKHSAVRAINAYPRQWPEAFDFFGEYACEAHVPRQVPTEIAGWHVIPMAADAYEAVPEGHLWECEWPSHQVYLDPPAAHRDLLCGTVAPWRHRNGDHGRDAECNEPHYVCDAHHTVIVLGGYHPLVNAAVAQEGN